MPITSPYVFLASMDVDLDKDDLFNEVYDREHIPNLLRVPGVLAVSRMSGTDFALGIGGEIRTITHQPARYLAVYEIESPDVLISAEWAEAVESGRWPDEVRPFTRNRSHALYRLR